MVINPRADNVLTVIRKYLTRTNAIAVLAGSILLAMNQLGWYRRWWWYDNVAHLLGGLAIGAFLESEDSTIGVNLTLTLLLALAWELLEYHEGVYPWDGSLEQRAAAEDTVLDTVLVAGAAYAVARANRT